MVRSSRRRGRAVRPEQPARQRQRQRARRAAGRRRCRRGRRSPSGRSTPPSRVGAVVGTAPDVGGAPVAHDLQRRARDAGRPVAGPRGAGGPPQGRGHLRVLLQGRQRQVPHRRRPRHRSPRPACPHRLDEVVRGPGPGHGVHARLDDACGRRRSPPRSTPGVKPTVRVELRIGPVRHRHAPPPSSCWPTAGAPRPEIAVGERAALPARLPFPDRAPAPRGHRAVRPGRPPVRPRRARATPGR